MHSLSNLPSYDAFDPSIEVPECLQKYLSLTEDPHEVHALIRDDRARRTQLLTRRFYNQIQYGCKNSACQVPTCLSYRKRIATGPVRLHNEVTARALAVRCVERYTHRGRDIDRIPKRDKNKKLPLHYDAFPNNGLCYSDPVVPWYADSTEYLNKKNAAAQRVGYVVKTQMSEKDNSSAQHSNDEAPEQSSIESSAVLINEAAVTSTVGNLAPLPAESASEFETAVDSTSNTASSASSMDANPPSPIVSPARLDTASLTQSLFSSPAVVHAVKSSLLYQQILNGRPVRSISRSLVPGLGKVWTFSLLPASVMVYLRDLLTTSRDDSVKSTSDATHVEKFVEQSISYVLTNPSRLLSSASTWDKYQTAEMFSELQFSIEILAEGEDGITASTNLSVLPEWGRVHYICEEVFRSQDRWSFIFAQLQRLINHAYTLPHWLGTPKSSEKHLCNRELVHLTGLILNIAYSTMHTVYDVGNFHCGNDILPSDYFPHAYSNLHNPDTMEPWMYQPEIVQLAVNIADVFSYRRALDVAVSAKSGSHTDKATAAKTDIIRTLLEVLTDNNVVRSDVLKHNSYAACLLEMMRAVVLLRWDRSPVIDRNGSVAGALAILKGLYRAKTRTHLEERRFVMEFVAEALDELEMPFEWLQFRADSEKMHILQFPFLLPDTALVNYFRSINLKIMKHSYDKAMEIYTIGNAQLLFGRWRVNNVHEVLQRTRPHMARYFVMTVRRDHLLEDAIGQIWHREHQELARPLKVRMGEDDGEVGLDHGGVQQELFRLMFNEAFNPEYSLFDIDNKTRMAWFKPGSLEPLYKYEALGVLVSLAIYNGITIPMNMPHALYRIILGFKVKAIEHIEDGWPDLASSFEQLLAWEDGDVGDVMCRTYEFSYEAYGRVVSTDMTRSHPASDFGNIAQDPNLSEVFSNSDKPEAPLVTNANREAFVKDYIAHLTSKSVEPQLKAFLKGVKTLLSPQALSLFPPERLKVLFEGHPTTQSIDISEWKDTTTYEDYSVSEPVIVWFWEILTEHFSQEQLRKLLEFVTASDRIPISGWKGITFIIQRNAAGNEWLPASSTCYGRLFLPEYSSKEILREKLEKAIETNYGFGMV